MKKKIKTVTIIIKNGVAAVLPVPAGVRVCVRDEACPNEETGETFTTEMYYPAKGNQ